MWLHRSIVRAALTLGLALLACRVAAQEGERAPPADVAPSPAATEGGGEEIPLLLGAPEIDGDYDPASVRRVVARHLGDVRRCFAASPRTSRARLRFTIDARGRVRSAGIPGPPRLDLQAIALDDCVTTVARRWRFPPPAAPVEVVIALRVRAGIGDGYSSSLRPDRGLAVRARIGRPEVRGSLTRAAVRRVVERHLAEVRFCHEQELARRPDLRGEVTIAFIVAPTGAVASAAISSTTLASPPVEGCLTRAVRRWAFPAPGEGVAAVRLPLVLELEERRARRTRAAE